MDGLKIAEKLISNPLNLQVLGFSSFASQFLNEFPASDLRQSISFLIVELKK